MKKKLYGIVAIVLAAVLVGVIVWRVGSSGPDVPDPSQGTTNAPTDNGGQGTTGTPADPSQGTTDTPTDGTTPGGDVTEPENTDPNETAPDGTTAPNESTPDGTEPVETDPTEPATEPTEPATDPTEPATEPTEPAATPTEPDTATDPTEDTQEVIPTEKPTEATEPKETEHVHTWKETPGVPTCEEDGYTTRTCTECGYFCYVDVVKKLGHDWTDWVITVEPTTTSVGERQRTCSHCGTVTEVIPMLDAETGEAYESYIDPRIVIRQNRNNTSYKYEDFAVVDFRTWGDPPSIWINDDNTWTVVFFSTTAHA